MRLSMRWAKRCREAFVPRPGYGLFGIVQGSVFPALRAESVAALTAIGFEGYAVGGLAVGEGQAAMFGVLDCTMPLLPADGAALPDGRGHAGRHPRRRDARHRHVRLRDPDPRRAAPAAPIPGARQLNLRNARHAEDAGRSTPAAPAPPARGTAAPICTT